jgi:hypothetical protein
MRRSRCDEDPEIPRKTDNLIADIAQGSDASIERCFHQQIDRNFANREDWEVTPGGSLHSKFSPCDLDKRSFNYSTMAGKY